MNRNVLLAAIAALVLIGVVLGAVSLLGDGSGESESIPGGSSETVQGVDPFSSLPSLIVGPEEAPIPESDEQVCLDLANDISLRSLPSALMLLSDPDQDEKAVNVVEESVRRMRAAAEASDGALAQALGVAADALLPISRGELTAASVSSASEALDGLGREVDSRCGF